MVILLPFYLLKLRRRIENAKKRKDSATAIRENAPALKDLINKILKTLADNENAGYITGYDAFVLSGLVKMFYDHLYGTIQEFIDEGVSTMLDDILLVEYEEEIIDAKLKMAMGMLKKGMSPEDVAEISEFPIGKIRKLQLQATPIV